MVSSFFKTRGKMQTKKFLLANQSSIFSQLFLLLYTLNYPLNSNDCSNTYLQVDMNHFRKWIDVNMSFLCYLHLSIKCSQNSMKFYIMFSGNLKFETYNKREKLGFAIRNIYYLLPIYFSYLWYLQNSLFFIFWIP